MSYRGNLYDGSNSRRNSDSTKRRDSIDYKDETYQYAPSKRTGSSSGKKNRKSLNSFFQEDSADKDRYLLTYSDLITLLLGLFIILYAMSNIDSKKYTKLKEAFGSVFGYKSELTSLPKNGFVITKENIFPIKRTRDLLQEVIDKNNYQNAVKLIDNERGITIRILDDILFNSGDANLLLKSRSILNKLADIIKVLPNDIRIEGHTDNVPINSLLYPSNWHLSVARATNTAYYLMENEGINPEKVSIVGYGEYKPVASNNSPEGRALNRRVDIVILNKHKE